MSLAAENLPLLPGEELDDALLREIALAGPSRAPDIVSAFVDLEGLEVHQVVDALDGLARRGLIEVRAIEGLPYWLLTPAGQRATRWP